MSDKEIKEDLQVFASIKEYCDIYNIPRENLLDILEDQKVLPMIRGKATEYIGAAILRKKLDSRDWIVSKMNLNPQPGENRGDEDVTITFRRNGVSFRVETKNAVRGSFRTETRNTPHPHFSVKCHRSRSNFSREHNDRYLVGDFDVLICNVSNAVFRRRSIDRGLPFIEDEEAIKWLKKYYGVAIDDELRRAAYDDWRACLPHSIADERGIIPRTPKMLMINDPNWFELDKLAINLRSLLNGR